MCCCYRQGIATWGGGGGGEAGTAVWSTVPGREQVQQVTNRYCVLGMKATMKRILLQLMNINIEQVKGQ